MKYILNNPQTTEFLQAWSPPGKSALTVGKLPHELLLAGHFFWINGSKVQRSQERLLRSIIYDIVRKCPEMTDLISSNIIKFIGEAGRMQNIWNSKTLFETLTVILSITESTQVLLLH